MSVKRIDQKHGIQVYETKGGNAARLVKITEDGRCLPIPDEEPTILFRGRDYLAVPLLEHYIELCRVDGATDFQLSQMQLMVDRFRKFAIDNPGVMKQPGIARGL